MIALTTLLFLQHQNDIARRIPERQRNGVVHRSGGKWHASISRLLRYKINMMDLHLLLCKRRSSNIMLICSLVCVLLFARTFPLQQKLGRAYAVRWKKLLLLLSLFCMRSSRFPQNLLRKHHRDVSCLPASETQHVACLLLRASLSLPGFVGQADIFCIEIHSVHLTHLYDKLVFARFDLLMLLYGRLIL